jgi:nicotinate-nucleotide adenylyltransferase
MADRTERILYFGGSFNPIHDGHLRCAKAVADAAGYTKVVLIPSGVPPHRSGQPDMASAPDRLTMCHLAVENDRLFGVSDIELRRSVPSFTLETARYLKSAGAPRIDWLIGADTVPRLPTWHGYPGLLDEVHFVVMRRPDAELDWDRLPMPLQQLRSRVIDAPLIPISASQVRQKAKAGEDLTGLVPQIVAEYIASRGLYRSTPAKV